MIIEINGSEICNEGKDLATNVFQSYIDKIAAAGGGELIVPPGLYLLGALELPSNFILNLQPGAEILASDDINDYKHLTTQSVAELSKSALLYAVNKKNITICGSGVIQGQDEKWFAAEADPSGYRMPKTQRPRMLVMEGCENVQLRDFSVVKSPMWTIHLACCQRITIDNISVDNNLYLPNTDSLDIDSCKQVKIINCYLSASDDGVCIKTARKEFGFDRSARNITVSNCVIRSRGAAIKVGTETFDDVEDVIVSNITVFDSNRAVALVSRDGGNLRNMIFSNITFECQLCVPHHWGKAEPIGVSVRYRDPKIIPGVIENIIFSNMTGSAHGAINIYSEIQGGIKNISFNSIILDQKVSDHVDYGCYDIRPPCNPENPTGMGVDNSYKIDSKTGKPFGVEKYGDGIPAIYSVGVSELVINNFKLLREQPENSCWNKETEFVSIAAPDAGKL